MAWLQVFPMVQKNSHWFPVACAYPWKGELVEESEVVLLIKTQADYQDLLEVIHQQMTYTNFTAEITPTAVNYGFLEWLYAIVPPRLLPASGQAH